MVTNRLYLLIEGTSDTSNGDLRKGFRKLLEQKLKDRMPTIAMCNSKEEAIKKFKNKPSSLLLCDLDANKENYESDLKKHGLTERRNDVFYMIQEMEAWFISQPDILDEYYEQPISKKLPQKPAKDFPEPDTELVGITKDTRKGTYHKVRHGVALLSLLDAKQLCDDFTDFKRLVDRIELLKANQD
jgi:hypothetical protein